MQSITYPFPVETLQTWRLQDVVDEIQQPQRLVDIQETSSVNEALKRMAAENISALLVFKQSEQGKEYQCFITLKDIIQFVVFQVSSLPVLSG